MCKSIRKGFWNFGSFIEIIRIMRYTRDMFTLFWKNLTSSIYNPAFYKRVLGGERVGTKSFVVLFSLWAAVVACVFVWIGALGAREVVKQLPKYIADAYPDTMVLTLTPGGVLSVAGVEEPVKIPLPAMGTGTSSGFGEMWGDMQYVAVIDTKTPYTLDVHKQSKAFVWFGERMAWSDTGGMGEDEQRYVDMMKGETEPAVITKTDAEKAARVLVGYAGYIVPVALVATLVFTTLFYASGMVVFGLLIGGLLLLILRVLPEGRRNVYAHVTYRAATRAAIFAGVLPSIVMMVSWFTPVGITYGLYTLMVLGILWVNMRGVKTGE